MTLHITDPQTDKLARELARETGESLTKAVSTALKERLSRVKTKRGADDQRFLADIEKIVSGVRPKWRRGNKTGREMIDDMYGEDGLPR
ncbi:MAG: type II toxin-antitoxin system VapB family antitoxin [Alphaproteobacteria bacterium]|nr:type II toxin-antitoxin system VapB family antitoxin [Alphaproteobacteria bacterium]